MTLRVECSGSPTSASFALGGGQLTPLQRGANAFSSGGDKATVYFGTRAYILRDGDGGSPADDAVSAPTLTEWATIFLALLVVGFGAWRLRQDNGSTPTPA